MSAWPRWRHKKRGSECRELSRAPIQIATTSPVEGDIIVWYEHDDGSQYCRAQREFEDGRFERLPDARPSALDDVAAERRRQIEDEGYTAEHDGQHADRELAKLAAAYLLSSWIRDDAYRSVVTDGLTSWQKPKMERERLVCAAALIIAEIERLDRASEGGKS